MDIYELHRQIFHPVIEHKFEAGETAYVLDSSRPNVAFKAKVLKVMESGNAHYTIGNVISIAVHPHYGSGSNSKLVKAEEVPANLTKIGH